MSALLARTAGWILIALTATPFAWAQQRDRDHRGKGASTSLCQVPTVYESPGFRGRSLALETATRDLRQLDFGDRISSICVPVGYLVELFEHDSYRGRELRLDGPVTVAALADRGFDEMISSVRVQDRRASRPGGRRLSAKSGLEPNVRDQRTAGRQETQLESEQLTARFDWSMPPRFNARFYDRLRHAYDASYVNPDGWSVRLWGCGSTPANLNVPIVSYTWQITQADQRYQRRYTTQKCEVALAEPLDGSPPVATARLAGAASRRPPLPAPALKTSVSRRGIPTAGRKVASNDVSTGGVDDDHVVVPDTTDPDFERLPKLPRLGHYRVSLTVKDKLGHTDTTTQDVTLRDYLIVVIGDSAASGQGNPDQNGSEWEDPLAGISPLCETSKLAQVWVEGLGFEVPMETEPYWVEPLAQRSYLSGHAKAAFHLEREDPKSSVTFVTYASTGAKIADLSTQAQRRFQREKFRCSAYDTDCGQLREVRATIGDRPVDALLISVGINDLQFSNVLKAAVKGGFDEQRRTTEGTLNSIVYRYRSLADALERLAVRDIYLTGYPIDIFSSTSGETDDGCGIFDTSLAGKIAGFDGVSRNEALLLRRLAIELEEKMELSARTYGWHFVKVSDAFHRHGYCADDSFFRGAEDSCKTQGDTNGTMHPNAKGHGVYAERLLELLRRYTMRAEEEKLAPGI